MIHRDVPGGLSSRTVLTVTNLTLRIKALLEESFSFIWVEGEVSNLRIPSSGHFYFTIKDSKAQISAVMFKNQAKSLKFDLKDGAAITGLGRISVYEPRGNYQIIFEYIEPKGAGSLQLAFEQLKEKLAGEGLFDQSRKKQIPFLPSKICVITSPSGAVIRDIITVAKRRFPSVRIEIIPSSVQGDTAVLQLIEAIQTANINKESDVIIIARGGGSLEDLAPFNSEALARAIAASEIPIISAVGHETDFTICDFVADLRAPTPSAAAEMALPDSKDLTRIQRNLENRLLNSIKRQTGIQRIHLSSISKRLVDPRKKIQDLILRCDDLTSRLNRAMSQYMEKRHTNLNILKNYLIRGKTFSDLKAIKYRNRLIERRLIAAATEMVGKKKTIIERLEGKLAALNPESVLSRGYSITRRLSDKKIVMNENEVKKGMLIESLLYSGSIISRVEGKDE